MSVQPINEPVCREREARESAGAQELTIEARIKSLGEFDVRRVLPASKQPMVGPFIFFDHMGPAVFPPGSGIQVRPHPHIGIATITYLFEGEIMHRDSLGYTQPIAARAVNLMTAGRGIVHSERAGDDLTTTSKLHGIQSWMALPNAIEEIEPSFIHYPAAVLPQLTVGGATVRVIIGEAFGAASPVLQHSPTIYLEAIVPAGVSFSVPVEPAERAVYVVAGTVHLDDAAYGEGTLLVLRRGAPVSIVANTAATLMVLGGDPVGKRHIWWNFVSSSLARIEQAKADWREHRFAKVPGDAERIPLPDE